MQPYGKGNTTANATNGPESNITKMLNRTCEGPVCGADGNTYGTDCAAEAEGVAVASPGACAVCNDSDGGVLVNVFGTAAKGSESHDDYCANGSTVAEYSCVENSIVMLSVPCDEGKECQSGKCVSATPPEHIGEESGNGTANETPNPGANQTLNLTGCQGPDAPNVTSKDTVTFNGKEYNDTCADYTTVTDYFCKNNNISSQNNQCDPGSNCNGGKCVRPDLTCTEDDTGNDTSMRSTTLSMRGFTTVYRGTDECVDDGKITEYYCLENGSATSAEILCGNAKKCVSGRCIRSTCNDTDGGINIYVNGTVKSGASNATDDCINDNQIDESYCYGDDIQNEILDCGDGYTCHLFHGSARCEEGS